MIKGYGCANGRKHRNWLSKEYMTYLTMSTEGLIISCMIDAMEVRDIACSDIPGDFLQTDYNIGDMHIKWKGEW